MIDSTLRALSALMIIKEEEKKTGRSVSVNRVSVLMGVSYETARTILLQLKYEGLVESKRGRKGGYGWTEMTGKMTFDDVDQIFLFSGNIKEDAIRFAISKLLSAFTLNDIFEEAEEKLPRVRWMTVPGAPMPEYAKQFEV